MMNLLPRDHLPALSGLILALLLLLYQLWRRGIARISQKKTNLPPEPSGAWPVVGHLHLLADQNVPAAHRVLGDLADEYGPVFMIRLGVHPAVIVSSWEAVRDCFTTNDRALAKRPASTQSKYLGYNYAGFGFTHGRYWREVRKLVLLEVLSSRRLEALKSVRISEIDNSIKELYKAIQENPGKLVIISHWIEQLTLNIIMMMISGKRYSDTTHGGRAESFKKVIKEFMYISGQFVPSDSIPFPPLRWLDFQGHIKSMKRISNELDTVFQGWIEEHVQAERDGGNEQDFIDLMLSTIDDKFAEQFGHTRETIVKATVSNLILAGSDTTSIHLTWLLCLLLNNPKVLQRARQEIDNIVGKDRWVEESDTTNLVYLQAIIKETLRLNPPGPLAVPHEAIEDCHIRSYLIPKGTRVLVNVWKLHRDPRIWVEPDKFIPERFLASHVEVDASGQHFEFIPFGSGRRSCPGYAFAMQVTQLTLARLIQGFDFATPSDLPVDMSEGQGITMPKAIPLEVLVTPRPMTKKWMGDSPTD